MSSGRLERPARFQAYSGNRSVSADTLRRTSGQHVFVRDVFEHPGDQRCDFRISASPKPRVVTAGLPNRMPLGFSGGFVSNGMAFLLAVM